MPPVTVDQTLDFYEGCIFDAGVSVDHIIFGYEPDATFDSVDPAWAERRRLTLRLAEEFMGRVATRGAKLEPVGAAQGWSPTSYSDSVKELQNLGYRRIALGGMVPLKTHEILACLEGIDAVRKPDTEFHLLGITRVASMAAFAALGVTSFDSTSAFRQAFMDDRLNYHTNDNAYVAIRVPQVDGNPTLRRAVLAGRVAQREAVEGERECIRALRAYDCTDAALREALWALANYERICQSRKSYLDQYERTLRAAPWKDCTCSLCRDLGIEVAIFRGTERNKRRGFHNLSVLADKMRHLHPDHEMTEEPHG